LEKEWKTHDNDEEINDLLWVSFNIQNKRVGDIWWRRDNDDNLGPISDRSSAARSALTEGIKCMINPGSGDFPVGQFEAQNLFPNGRGIPSFASSVMKG
jgi:hypothetical protein